MGKPTKMPVKRPRTTLEPWQSWGMTVRYLVIRLGLAVPCIVLTLLAIGCH